MPVVDTLVTRFVLDDQDYAQGAAKVQQATAGMSSAISGLSSAVPLIGTALAAMALTAAGAFGAVVNAGAEMEAQIKALSLYETAGHRVADMLKTLGEVAKLPGLGNIEAIQAAVKMLAGGFDFNLSVRSMMAFGNALAAAGGSKEGLDGVILALTQIASKGQVSAEEINQIAERVPQIRNAMKEAFGTASSEAIQKLGITAEQFILGVVGALEKLPKAADTMKNTLSNLGDFFNTALSDIGMGINAQIMGPMNQIAKFGEYLKSINAFGFIGDKFGELFGAGGGTGTPLIVTVLAYVTSTLSELPAMIEKVGSVVGGVMTNIGKWMMNMYDRVAKSWIGWAMGLKEGDLSGLGDAIAAGAGGWAFGDNTLSIHRRAQNYLQGFKEYNPEPFTPPTGGGFTSPTTAPEPQSELQKQTKHLSAIERNTDTRHRNTILGGGNLGAQGITPVELSTIKSGGRHKAQMADLLEKWIGEVAAQQARDFLRSVSPILSR